MRTFTLPEAQTLLPVLDALLQRAQAAASVVNDREHALQALSQAIFLSGGYHVDLSRVARIKGEHEKALVVAKDTLAEIEATGVEIKELETGLLEFPFQLEDHIVMLCWLQGESTITQWHAAEESFAERQPIDERFTRGNRPQ